jgi:hypothetical protein
MRHLVIAILALAIVAVVVFIGYALYIETRAVNECRARGFAHGNAFVNGAIVCYRGEVIQGRRR